MKPHSLSEGSRRGRADESEPRQRLSEIGTAEQFESFLRETNQNTSASTNDNDDDGEQDTSTSPQISARRQQGRLASDSFGELDVPSVFDSFAPSHKDFWHMAATLSADGIPVEDDESDKHETDDGNYRSSWCAVADTECMCCAQSWFSLKRKLKTFLMIAFVGAVSTGLAIGFRALLALADEGTTSLMMSHNMSQSSNTQLSSQSDAGTYFSLLACFVCALVASVLITSYISPQAAGSGIPRMKAVFGGVYLPNFLSLRTLCAKTLGLLGSVASGLSVGSEGPFVHIACCIAAVLLRIPMFRFLNRNIVRRHGIIAMGCVAGVVAAFGTPFGGLLFAIEVVATYFKISDLPQMLWAALVGVLVVWLSDGNTALLALFSTNFTIKRLTYLSLFAAAALGALCGVLGGGFVLLLRRVGLLRRRLEAFVFRLTRRSRQSSRLSRDVEAPLNHGASQEVPVRRRCCNASLGGVIMTAQVCTKSHHAYVGLALFLGLLLLIVQFSLNFTFASLGFPSVFNQRQLIQQLFNTSLTLSGNSSSGNDYGYSSNSSCPAAGQPFEMLPSTYAPGTSTETSTFYYFNGAVTMPTFCLFLVSRFLLTPFALQVPLVPSGLFTPIFLIGALVGRFWGILLGCALQQIHFDTHNTSSTLSVALTSFMNSAPSFLSSYPWNNTLGLQEDAVSTVSELSAAEYAVLGAAAFAGATTRTISTVVIVMELTGSLYLQLPVAICVIAAYFVANGISPSVYELMQSLDSLPILPAVDESLSHHKALDAMVETNERTVIIPPLTIGQAREVLDATVGGEIQFISVVESAESMVLIGEVQRMLLVNLVLDHDEECYSTPSRRSSVDNHQRRSKRLSRARVTQAQRDARMLRWSTSATTYGSTLDAAIAARGIARKRASSGGADDRRIMLVTDCVSPALSSFAHQRARGREDIEDATSTNERIQALLSKPYISNDQAVWLRDAQKRTEKNTANTPKAILWTSNWLTLPVDLSTLQLSWSTPLYRVNILVHMLRMYVIVSNESCRLSCLDRFQLVCVLYWYCRYHAHVVDAGRLMGYITRPQFIRYCARLKHRQSRARKWQTRARVTKSPESKTQATSPATEDPELDVEDEFDALSPPAAPRLKPQPGKVDEKHRRAKMKRKESRK